MRLFRLPNSNFGASDPSGGNAFISGKNSNSLVIQGTKAQIDAILASLTIAFSADADAMITKFALRRMTVFYDSSGVLTTGANGGSGALNADGTTMDATNNRVYQRHRLAGIQFERCSKLQQCQQLYRQ